MRLIDVTLRNLRRRKGRVALLVLGLALGAGTVVALMAITQTMQKDIGVKLDQYGANVLVVPRSSQLTLSYGGLSVAAAPYDVGELSTTDVERIWAIDNAASLNAVAPKLLGAARLRGQTILMAGVLFEQEVKLKPWWALKQGQMRRRRPSRVLAWPGSSGFPWARAPRCSGKPCAWWGSWRTTVHRTTISSLST